MPREICKKGPPMQPVVVSAGGGAALGRLHLILYCRMMCIVAAICICVLIIHAFVTAFRITAARLSLTAVDLLNARCVAVVVWRWGCIAATPFLDVCFFCSGMCIDAAGFAQKYEVAVWP